MTTQKSPYDYSEFTETPDADDLGRLAELAKDQFAAEQEVAEADAALKAAKAKLRDIAERDIPELMATIGVSEFSTTSGLKIKIRRVIRASIPVAKRPTAYRWLDDHGEGGMIKRSVLVGFNRDQQDEARSLLDDLRKKFENVREDQKVEPSTLRAWIREQLDAGKTIPMELFGAQEVRVADIKTS